MAANARGRKPHGSGSTVNKLILMGPITGSARCASTADEYEDYCALGLETALGDGPSAIEWWCEPRQRTRFPNLYKMAVDVLSIPAMSAEPERLFSECKRILTSDRHSMQADTLEAIEGLKSFNCRRPL
jgi:hypothetical protein